MTKTENPIVYSHGLPPYRGVDKSGPPNPRQVELCKAWIEMWGDRRRTINPRAYSYGLKAHVEHWAGEYVTNGAFIAAALQLGYEMQPYPPNAFFNMSLARLRRHSRRWHLIGSYCPKGCTPDMTGELARAVRDLREADAQRRQTKDRSRAYLTTLQAQPEYVLFTLEVLMYVGRELRDYPDSAEAGRWLLRAYAWDFRKQCRDARIGALLKIPAIEHIDRGIAFARQRAPAMLFNYAVELTAEGPPPRRRRSGRQAA